MDGPFTAALQAQANLMVSAGRSLDTRGYAVVVVGLNADATSDRFLFPYLSGGMTQFLKVFGPAAGLRRPPIIRVNPHCRTVQEREALTQSGKVFDGPFNFCLTIGKTRQFQPVLAALELFGSVRTGRYDKNPKGAGVFTVTRMSDYVEVAGSGKDALTALLRILEMPQHRECLLKRKF